MFRKLLALLVILASACANARAQDISPDRRPDAARRMVAYFSFDEKDNPQEVPTYWFRSQEDSSIGRKRPGFPGWNKAELDLNIHAKGTGSVRLPTRGGSTSLTLERGVIPVFEGADYQVSFLVRTEHLISAKAALEARFLDASGKLIESTATRSRPVNTNGEWTELTIDLLGGTANVAFLQIELLLLQPDQLKARAGVSPDLSGDAWFDEIRVVQLPRIELSTRVPGNIVIAPEVPRLEAMVRDLTGEELQIRLDLLDTAGKIMFTERRDISPGRSYSTFSPKLPGYGWYRSRVSVLRNDTLVGVADVDFVWLKQAATLKSPDFSRFGVVSEDSSPASLNSINAIARGLSVSQVSIPAWSVSLDKSNIQQSVLSLVPIVNELSKNGFETILSLPALPEEAAQTAKADPDHVWALLELDPKVWRPWLDPFLDRFGSRVTRWQVGSINAPHQGSLSTLAKRATTVRDVLATLVPGPSLRISFPGDYATPALPSSVRAVMRVPTDVPPEAVSSLLGSGNSYVLPRNTDESLTAQQRIDDLARRTVELWAAVASDPNAQVAIEHPWILSSGRRPEVSPAPEFAVFRTLLDHLSGYRVVTRLPGLPGVRAYLFAPVSGGSEGTVIAWNESADAAHAYLAGVLGQGQVKLVDLFGNSSDPPLDTTISEDQRNTLTPNYRIPLSSTPVIVENVDLPLLRFVAGVTVDPPILQATTRAEEHSIRFKNTWPSGLTTKFMIIRPGSGRSADGSVDRSWTISPRVGRATLAANEEAHVPFMIGFAPTEEAGAKPMTIDFDLSAERQYGIVRIETELQLALDGIDLQVQAFRSPTSDGPDLVVEAAVSNQTGQTLNARLTAFVPEMPRDRRTISALESGSRATRRFVIKGMAKQMHGARIVLSLTEERQNVRLNKSVIAP